jgi:hypothetical protein
MVQEGLHRARPHGRAGVPSRRHGLPCPRQDQCQFEPGEVRVMCVEAQPMFQSTLHWRLVDAATGPIDEGHVTLDELAKRAPWDYGHPESSSAK